MRNKYGRDQTGFNPGSGRSVDTAQVIECREGGYNSISGIPYIF